ncbi:C40 family peptidase [Alcaligenaceae bacterium]|nr:C40 family peptidase [Alcaligenaceae bacterium]
MTTKSPLSRPGLYFSFLLAALLILAGCAGSGGKRAGQPAQSAITLDPQQRSEVILTALTLLESQYQYGGSHPAGGFDCSGLVAYVFNNAARQPLPHNTAEIARLSRPISRKKLKAGDFVFFNTLNRSFSHMGIYIGDGRFINAPSTGGQVRIDTLSNPYYAKRFESARTLFGS